jgi:hypothetical protein
MVMAVYPFWASVATQVGRLLSLQGSAAAAHIQRRLREQYGERETVSRAARRVLRCYIDWRVLCETSAKGVYRAESAQVVEDSGLIAWLVEASLYAQSNGAAPLSELLHGPRLFPFRLKEIDALRLASASSHLDLLRHGMDEDLVMLRTRTD